MRDSPCIGVCTTLYDEVCRGCGRSASEVSNWVFLNQAQKDLVWARLDIQDYVVELTGLTSDTVVEIYNMYNQEGRHYHNWEHIAEGFRLVHEHGLKMDFDQARAWLFHDCVYDPKSTDNEKLSAELAEQKGSGIATTRMILDTIDHVPTITRSALVLDLDLYRLSVHTGQFFKNRDDIRAEYIGHLSHEDFTNGTREFADRMLKRDRLYHTEFFRRYEQSARFNLLELINRKL